MKGIFFLFNSVLRICWVCAFIYEFFCILCSFIGKILNIVYGIITFSNLLDNFRVKTHGTNTFVKFRYQDYVKYILCHRYWWEMF